MKTDDIGSYRDSEQQLDPCVVRAGTGTTTSRSDFVRLTMIAGLLTAGLTAALGVGEASASVEPPTDGSPANSQTADPEPATASPSESPDTASSTVAAPRQDPAPDLNPEAPSGSDAVTPGPRHRDVEPEPQGESAATPSLTAVIETSDGTTIATAEVDGAAIDGATIVEEVTQHNRTMADAAAAAADETARTAAADEAARTAAADEAARTAAADEAARTAAADEAARTAETARAADDQQAGSVSTSPAVTDDRVQTATVDAGVPTVVPSADTDGGSAVAAGDPTVTEPVPTETTDTDPAPNGSDTPPDAGSAEATVPTGGVPTGGSSPADGGTPVVEAPVVEAPVGSDLVADAGPAVGRGSLGGTTASDASSTPAGGTTAVETTPTEGAPAGEGTAAASDDPPNSVSGLGESGAASEPVAVVADSTGIPVSSSSTADVVSTPTTSGENNQNTTASGSTSVVTVTTAEDPTGPARSGSGLTDNGGNADAASQTRAVALGGEQVPERVTEQVPERVTEQVPERVTEQVPKRVTDSSRSAPAPASTPALNLLNVAAADLSPGSGSGSPASLPDRVEGGFDQAPVANPLEAVKLAPQAGGRPNPLPAEFGSGPTASGAGGQTPALNMLDAVDFSSELGRGTSMLVPRGAVELALGVDLEQRPAVNLLDAVFPQQKLPLPESGGAPLANPLDMAFAAIEPSAMPGSANDAAVPAPAMNMLDMEAVFIGGAPRQVKVADLPTGAPKVLDVAAPFEWWRAQLVPGSGVQSVMDIAARALAEQPRVNLLEVEARVLEAGVADDLDRGFDEVVAEGRGPQEAVNPLDDVSSDLVGSEPAMPVPPAAPEPDSLVTSLPSRAAPDRREITASGA